MEFLYLLVFEREFVALVLDGGEEGVELFVVDVEGIAVVYAGDEVAKNIHIVGEGIIGRVVDTAIAAVAVGLGAHKAQVVGGLQIVEVLHEATVAADAHAVGDAIEFVAGFALHDVAEPGREVALFVYPRCGIGHVERTGALHLGADFGGRAERDAALLELLGQGFHEFKNVRRKGLEDAEGAEFHEDVDDLLLFGQLGNPVSVSVGKEGIFAPRGIVEAEADIFGEAVIAQKELQLGGAVAVIDEVGALPTEHVLGTFGKHALEAHAGHKFTDFVGIDKARVAEYLGLFAEEEFHLLAEALHFVLKALFVLERGEAVGIGLGKELNATRFVELLEEFDDLRRVVFELLDGAAGKGNGALEEAGVGICHFDERREGGHVGTLCRFGNGAGVLVVVVIIMVCADVEEAIPFQVDVLVDFKI